MVTKTTHYGPCPRCHGEGRSYPPGWQDATSVFPPACTYCGGSGKVVTHITEETSPPQWRAPKVTDEMAAAAYNRFTNAVNDAAPCARCRQRGYHHGFGENGHDPDWCTACGGSGFVQKYDEQTAMKLAVEAALTCREGTES